MAVNPSKLGAGVGLRMSRLIDEAEAKRLIAESDGEAQSLEAIQKATGGDLDKAMQILLLSKYWRTQASLASSENTKVLFYPSKATVPLTYEGLKELVSSE